MTRAHECEFIKPSISETYFSANKNEPHVKSEIVIVKKFQHLIKSFLMVWTENFAKPGQKCFDQSQVN